LLIGLTPRASPQYDGAAPFREVPLVKFLRDTLLKTGTIDAPDVERLIVSDSPAEVVRQICDAVVPRFNLRFEQEPRRRWWLFEWPPVRRE
jgi:hypothetical protein